MKLLVGAEYTGSATDSPISNISMAISLWNP